MKPETIRYFYHGDLHHHPTDGMVWYDKCDDIFRPLFGRICITQEDIAIFRRQLERSYAPAGQIAQTPEAAVKDAPRLAWVYVLPRRGYFRPIDAENLLTMFDPKFLPARGDR